jgi:hypothetical protein
MAVADSARAELARRAKYRCEYCGYPEAASSTPLEVDHIIPEARGGRTTLDNLALCRRSCNLYKHVQIAATDSVTGETVSLFNPRVHQWAEHFILDCDSGEIHGLTPRGRATVAALALNSTHAIATRRLLIRLGLR